MKNSFKKKVQICPISRFFFFFYNILTISDYYFNLVYTMFVCGFKSLHLSLHWKFSQIMANNVHGLMIKWNQCVVSARGINFYGSFCLLSFRFSIYFQDFFIMRLFPRENSFLIFLKIWCSSSWKSGTLQSENLQWKIRLLSIGTWKIREKYDLNWNKSIFW